MERSAAGFTGKELNPVEGEDICFLIVSGNGVVIPCETNNAYGYTFEGETERKTERE